MTAQAEEFIPTRRTLLSRLKNWEDRESWKDFFDTYWKLIYGVALKAGLSAPEAQDVVQETILSVAKQMPTFQYDRTGSFKAWLLQITQRRIADQYRKRPPWAGQKKEPSASASDGTSETSTLGRVPAPVEDGVTAVWDEEWHKNLVDVAMENVKRQVTARQYQLFDLYVVKQWAVRDITRTLHVTAAQVYLAKHRIARLIQAEFKKLEAKLG